MKFPFSIKYRPDIESGKLHVVTEFGEAVKVLEWDSDFREDHPVVALVSPGRNEYPVRFKADGTTDTHLGDCTGRLFIVDED